MGVKGLIRDVIMFYVGIQLLLGGSNVLALGWILIITAIIFTIIGFLRMWDYA
jgi:hypothetical protein